MPILPECNMRAVALQMQLANPAAEIDKAVPGGRPFAAHSLAIITLQDKEAIFQDCRNHVLTRPAKIPVSASDSEEMADNLMQKWERSKQRYEQSGTKQSDEFWQWIDQMKGHEAATRKNERVYLVISKLRRIAENENRKGGSGGFSALRNSMPSSSMQSSTSLRSSQSMSKRKDPSRHDLSHPDSGDSRDDLSSSSDEGGDETTDVKKQLKSSLTVAAKMIVSALSTNISEASDTASDSSTSSLKRKRSSTDRGRNRKRPRYVPRYPSPTGIMPHKAFMPPLATPSPHREHQGSRGRSVSGTSQFDKSRSPSPSPQRADSPLLDNPWLSSNLKNPTKANSPPQSRFQGSKTSEQHWAVEVGGRYFELQVCKKFYGDGVKSFSQFTCVHRTGQEDREITEKIYVGRTHMTHRVLKEIGIGIMKTQPNTLWRSICLGSSAIAIRTLQRYRVPMLSGCNSFTTLPTYTIGIKERLVTVVEHRYFRIASGVHQLLDHWKSKKAVAQRTFESRETSSYRFTLQGNDAKQFRSCRTLRKNPYLIIHREYTKSERRPLGDSEERANNFWLWEPNRKVRRTEQLQELEMEQNIEIAKGIWKSLRKRKMDIEHEARLRVKWEQRRDSSEREMRRVGTDRRIR